jgi:hypothetical protein
MRAVGRRTEAVLGFDRHDLGRGLRVVGEVHPIARADLDHLAGQARE